MIIMDYKTKKSCSQNLMNAIHIYFAILLLILIAKFIFGEVNSLNDYIFGFFYFIIIFIILKKMLKVSYDKKSFFIWLAQLLLYVIFLFFEYHNIVKVFILYQVLVGALSSGQQIKVFKKQNEKIKYLSFHDEMTGLYNRRYFENILEELSNPEQHKPSVIIADINNLKVINDNQGHKEGDQYIKSTAELLKSELREKDIIFRIGGDEFAIILPDTNKEECFQIMNRIKKKVREHPKKNFSIAFGYVYNSSKYNNLEEMVNAADRQMYYNKKKIKKKLNWNLEKNY